jgi:uncharacterized protein (DUF58 family)
LNGRGEGFGAICYFWAADRFWSETEFPRRFPLDTSDLLRKVRKIEIKTKGLSNHLFSGEYHAVFKGRGMSFSEVREYQYGDDVRSIDWNVTARTGTPHIKVFEEERELTMMLVVDASGSSFFGTRQQFKNELIAEIAAVLAFSATTNNDKVGVLFFSDRIEQFVPPQKGRTQVLRIIRELLDLRPTGKGTDLTGALEFLNRVLKKHSICFVLSDFRTSGYERALRQTARKHDLIGIRLTDPGEETLPAAGLALLTDAESGRTHWTDLGDPATRSEWEKKQRERRVYFTKSFAEAGASQLSLYTDRPYTNALLAFFKNRR